MEPQCRGCRERDARIAALEAERARLAGLENRVAELEARLHDLSKTSSPPRPGAPLPKGPAKKATGHKPGGQPGHPPHLKVLLPPERVTRTVTFLPRQCAHCHQPLPKQAGPNDPAPLRHQAAELPEV